MVLNNVTKFHKILIKSIRLKERTSIKFWIYITKGYTYWKHGAISTYIELEEDIMVLNNVTKLH